MWSKLLERFFKPFDKYFMLSKFPPKLLLGKHNLKYFNYVSYFITSTRYLIFSTFSLNLSRIMTIINSFVILHSLIKTLYIQLMIHLLKMSSLTLAIIYEVGIFEIISELFFYVWFNGNLFWLLRICNMNLFCSLNIFKLHLLIIHITF